MGFGVGAGAGVVGAAVGGDEAAGAAALVVGLAGAAGGAAAPPVSAAGAVVTAPFLAVAGAVELAGPATPGAADGLSARLVGADGSGGGGPPAATCPAPPDITTIEAGRWSVTTTVIAVVGVSVVGVMVFTGTGLVDGRSGPMAPTSNAKPPIDAAPTRVRVARPGCFARGRI